MSRASLVGMLVAAEIVIVGLAIYAIAGTGRSGSFHGLIFAAHGLHRSDFVAKPIAPVQAGETPHVTIDDSDSRVVVTASTDGLVHVTDLTDTHRAFFSGGSAIRQLAVARPADGVAISRPSSQSDNSWGARFTFGISRERIEVQLPPGARLDVSRCSGADVTGIGGGVTAHSQDGHITLTNLKGDVVASSDDGSITAQTIAGDNVTLHSGDGRITLKDVRATSLNATTSDGRIEASGIAVSGASPKATLHSDDGSIHIGGVFAPGGAYEVTTKDGSVSLALAPGADLTVDASTGDGRIVVDGASITNEEGDSVRHTIRLGSGAGNLRVSSDDGSIHIQTNGAV
jgi:DUF4097 and DUF4098 domain-containing protein YvlB